MRAVAVRAGLAGCLIGVAMLLMSGPVGAATTTPVTPTTISSKQLAKQTTKTLAPLVIGATVILGLTFVANEIARTKRRRRKARKSVQRRPRAPEQPRPKRTRPPGSPKRPRVTTPPRVPENRGIKSPAIPPASGADRMWDRPAGGSAAIRAAELSQESAQWAAGSAGERQVGSELDRLPEGMWWVFHDIPRGQRGANVDHLVIGVGGVFCVNTKNIAGNVWVAERSLMVNGIAQDYLPVAVSEGRDVSQRLSRSTGSEVGTQPMLVFVEPITVKAMPEDVAVLDLRSVRAWLQGLPAVLTAAQAYEIVLKADDPRTWI